MGERASTRVQAAPAQTGTPGEPPVVVRINGYTYRSTIGSMGGVFKLPVSAAHRAAKQAFDALSPSRRKALIQQLESAKTAETRQRRLVKAVEGLHQA